MKTIEPLGTISCPYPGLRPFRREEAIVFFGRDEQVDQLLAKLDLSRFLAVVGTSGCGKSSLVRAGLIPAPKTGLMVSGGARWAVAAMRPGDQPIRNLARALVVDGVVAGPAAAVEHTPEFLAAALRRGPLGLAEALPTCRHPERGSSSCWSTSSRRSSASAARATAMRPTPSWSFCWPPLRRRTCRSTSS